MDLPRPAELLDMVRSLPAGGPLVERLGEHPEVHLVGGAVRDLLLGLSPTDLDLVVEGNGEGVASDLGGRVVRHERFGTWRADVAGHSYDIAQARTETYPHPGALPEVRPAALSEDLVRRDFTVNALAITLGGPGAGTLRAAPQGLGDLKRRWLRVLHDQSFRDDPTRVLRLARYASRLDFEVEPHTSELAASALDQGALATVSGNRVGAELRLAAAEPDPLAALLKLAELGVSRAIHPTFGLERDDLELARRALTLLPAEGRCARLVLGVAARRVRSAELHQLLDRLAFEAEDREVIAMTATQADRVAQALAGAESPSQVAEAAAGLAPELVALAGALGAERAARAWFDRLRHVRLEISGSDLLQTGIQEGPAIGLGLQAALAAKLDGRVNGREQELAVALEATQSSG
jgi:tRNA nucleotidyltransferase (CCA-adding enzyme)